MKSVNIINSTTEQKKLIFKICRENGYTIGRLDNSDVLISPDFAICKEEKCVFNDSGSSKSIAFENLNISKFIQWLNGEDNILDSYCPKKVTLKAEVLGKEITIFMGDYKNHTIKFAVLS